MNETWGKVHFALTFIASNCTFYPMHILGVGGHMRRIFDPEQYQFIKPLMPINQFITISAFVLGLAALVGAVVYGGLAWLLRAVGPADLQLLRGALRRR